MRKLFAKGASGESVWFADSYPPWRKTIRSVVGNDSFEQDVLITIWMEGRDIHSWMSAEPPEEDENGGIRGEGERARFKEAQEAISQVANRVQNTHKVRQARVNRREVPSNREESSHGLYPEFEEHIGELSAEVKFVMRETYDGRRSQRSIANELGVSAMTVGRMLAQGLQAIRDDVTK